MRAGIVLLVAIVACASGTRSGPSCPPLAQEFLTAGPAYRDCEVNERAQPVVAGDIEFNDRPLGANGCYVAEFDVVIDTTGRPIASTARMVRNNNSRFADAVRVSLEDSRYSIAKKNGQKVQQLVRYKRSMEWATRVVAVPAGSSPPMSPPTNAERVQRC